MLTERIVVDGAHPEPAAIARAADLLRAGGLVAFPTETVYGLGAHALDAAAVARIFAAKQRPANDPLIVHVADAEALAGVVAEVPARVRVLMQRFWPGPLTLLLPRHAGLPLSVTAGRPNVAVRVPNHPVALALLKRAGLPIAAPSANLFGHTSPTTAAHVLDDLDGRIDLVLDAGPTPIGVESTVLDFTQPLEQGPARVLRPGGVTLEALRAVLGAANVVGAAHFSPGAQAESAAIDAPGTLGPHYAPRTPLLLLIAGDDGGLDMAAELRKTARAAAEHGRRAVVLLYDEERLAYAPPVENLVVIRLGPIADPAEVARLLYDALRAADAAQGALILARELPGAGLAVTVNDRLRRAAHVLQAPPPARLKP